MVKQFVLGILDLERRNGKTVQVSSCRICLRFDDRTRMVSRETILQKPDQSAVVKNVLKIGLINSDLLSEICRDCVSRIDRLVQWIKDAEQMEMNYRCFENTVNSITVGSPESTNDVVESKLVYFQVEPIELKSEISDEFNQEVYKVEMLEEQIEGELISPDDNVGTNVGEIQPSPIEPTKTFKHPPNIPAKRGRKPKQKSVEEKKILKYKVILSRKCYICDKVLMDPEELMAHLTQLHSHGKNHKCPECNKSFKLITSLNRHLGMHDHTNRPLKCCYCPIGYKTKYSLLVHENRAHNAGHKITMKKKILERNFQCSNCGQTFRTNYDLLDHDRYKHQHLPGTTCKLCGKHFRNRASLRKHNIVHVGDKPYDCLHCDAAFKNTTNLVNHVARHHKSQKDSGVGENNDSYVECDVCSDEFPTKPQLIKHIEEAHLGMRQKMHNKGN
ncbi:zinc finger and SCAN domain-containing protein 2-like isoform X2 [Topomyia yanbarensis]|uniref:zinc finger and SCAN domain-containing protein 2-like isoform X2 n=1 Tax=Topomyia yanbarensis TaxID=2498891 RepID=UPI00273AEC08|nr:zinc finger and SCAN domain-containing protein 2-like isoform X2 [Topomyia yanbarensis]